MRFHAEMIAPVGLMILLLLFAAVRAAGRKRRISKPITVKTVLIGIVMAALFLFVLSETGKAIGNILAPL